MPTGWFCKPPSNIDDNNPECDGMWGCYSMTSTDPNPWDNMPWSGADLCCAMGNADNGGCIGNNCSATLICDNHYECPGGNLINYSPGTTGNPHECDLSGDDDAWYAGYQLPEPSLAKNATNDPWNWGSCCLAKDGCQDKQHCPDVYHNIGGNGPDSEGCIGGMVIPEGYALSAVDCCVWTGEIDPVTKQGNCNVKACDSWGEFFCTHGGSPGQINEAGEVGGPKRKGNAVWSSTKECCQEATTAAPGSSNECSSSEIDAKCTTGNGHTAAQCADNCQKDIWYPTDDDNDGIWDHEDDCVHNGSSWLDEDGYDCNGNCNGNYKVDECGVCGGTNTTCGWSKDSYNCQCVSGSCSNICTNTHCQCTCKNTHTGSTIYNDDLCSDGSGGSDDTWCCMVWNSPWWQCDGSYCSNWCTNHCNSMNTTLVGGMSDTIQKPTTGSQINKIKQRKTPKPKMVKGGKVYKQAVKRNNQVKPKPPKKTFDYVGGKAKRQNPKSLRKTPGTDLCKIIESKFECKGMCVWDISNNVCKVRGI